MKKNWQRWRRRTDAYLMRVVIVMLVAALGGGFLLVFYQDYASAAGNESITYTLQPSSADTYGDEKNPGTNYGSSAVMDVGSKTRNHLHSLVQFDISSIPIPPGATVNSANLSLYLSVAETTSRTHGAHRVTSSWAEGTVTFTTEPTFNATATASTVTGTTSGVWLTWDVATDISAYIGGTTNYGWLIKDSAEGIPQTYEFSYATKEDPTSSRHPTLSITFTAPWDSYSDVDHLVLSDDFTDFGDTVYMKGTGFASGNYTVGYYDGTEAGGGDWVAADENIVVGASGNLTSQYYLATDTERKGDAWWHVLVQPTSGYDPLPPTYDTAVAAPDTYGLLANDSFYVAQSAIPEFSTIMAAIMVVGLCFGIYYWMRRRRLAYVEV